MRHLLLALCMLPGAAYADLFQPHSKPDRVILHPDAAQVGRTLVLDMPEGQHEIRLSDLPFELDVRHISVELTGARLDAQVFRDEATASPGHFLRPAEERAAKDALAAARETLAAYDDGLNAIKARMDAAQARIDFLEGLGDADLTFDVKTLRELGLAISEDGSAARADIIAAQAELRRAQVARKPLEEAVQLAEVALDVVQGPFLKASELSLNVTAPEAGEVLVDLVYWARPASWEPVYRLKLQDGDDGTSVEVERGVAIQQWSGEDWRDVNLTVTSLAAQTQSRPSDLWPQRLRIEDKPNPKLSVQSRSYADGAAEPIIEAPVIVEESAPMVDTSGVGVVYNFDQPVSVRQIDTAVLALGTLEFSADVAARAVPSRNETAFRMVSFTNDSGERLLTGSAYGFVDDQSIGEIAIDTIEINDDVEIGFGPIHGLQLRRAVLDRSEGERGIISRGNVRDEQARLVIDNLSARDWDVTIVDQVPFSEQEDLEIAWRAQPAPTRQDVEDKRGILEWDLDIPAGNSREIVLNTEISWPDDKVLR